MAGMCFARPPLSVLLPPVNYIEERSHDVQVKVRARFRGDIDALAALGFRELTFYGEQFGLFSSVFSVPMWLMMLAKREVMRLTRGLQVNASFILMQHNNPATVSVPLALGVKMYTGFTDGTLLVSTNFPSCVPDEAGTVMRASAKAAIADSWAGHQQRVRTLEAHGKQIRSPIGFEYYVEISRQEEMAFR
jgi:hypothetical protein